MKLTSASVAVAFALTLFTQQPALCEDAPRLSARFVCRNDYQTNSTRTEILLDDVAAYYVAARNGASGQNPESRPPALTFGVLVKQPTQEVKWISIPLSAISNIDIQWLPLPRSTVGFKNLQISMKDGGVQSVDIADDGHEYRYVRKDKNGTVKQDIKGDLALRIDQAVPAESRGFPLDLSLEWFGFRGIGIEKQRPHSPDNEWILNREFIDRVEFVETADANR